MGLLTAIIIIVALIIDLLFLPAFLIIFDKKTDIAAPEEGLDNA
jgi:predicted RND superfamily exporter protein